MENDKKQTIKDCDFCGSDANFICFECKNYFCDNCFKIIHNLQKRSQHKKEKIDLFVPIELKCPQHPEIPINLFCLDDKGKI